MFNGVRELIRNPQGSRLQAEINVRSAAGERGELIEAARAALAARAYKEGWQALERHDLDQLASMTTAEHDARALAMGAEAGTDTWPKWQAGAVTQLLESYHVRPAGDDGTAWLHQAQVIINDAESTRDHALHLLRRHQSMLLLSAIIPFGFVVWGVIVMSDRSSTDLDVWWVPLGAAALGALGGIISALQRCTKYSTPPPADRLPTFAATLSRPVIGAVAGITVYIAFRAGIGVPEKSPVAYLLLYAFGAGFTERLIVRTADEGAPDAGAPAAPAPDVDAAGAPPAPGANGEAAAPPADQAAPADAPAPAPADAPAPAPADAPAPDPNAPQAPF